MPHQTVDIYMTSSCTLFHFSYIDSVLSSNLMDFIGWKTKNYISWEFILRNLFESNFKLVCIQTYKDEKTVRKTVINRISKVRKFSIFGYQGGLVCIQVIS